MNSKREVRRLRQRLEDALRENRRFRERIEVLASQNYHLRERSKESGVFPPEVTAFEEIESALRPAGEAIPEPKPSKRDQTWNFHAMSWLPVFEGGVRPLDPSPGMRCLTAPRAPIRIGFCLFGSNLEHIEEAVAKVEERQLRDRDFIPIFVTDNGDFREFRSRGYVFEYIPASIANSSKKQRSKRRVLKDRLDLIRAKWNLRDIIDLTR